MLLVVVVAATLLGCFTIANAFEVTFPSSSDYWVACKSHNVLKWTYDDKDPKIFSVALLNEKGTVLNGNYQVANSLVTAKGEADIAISCIPAVEKYYVAFVNASKYALDQPEKYYQSATFPIRDKSSPVLDGKLAASGSNKTISTAGSNSTVSTNATSIVSGQAANPASNVVHNANGADSIITVTGLCLGAASLMFLSAGIVLLV